MGLQLEEQRSLIEQFVRANAKFAGNEDLFDDFCNEAYQKSYIIFNSSSSVNKIESYVRKVVNTSIVSVLKDSGRLKRTSSGYVKSKELSFEEVPTFKKFQTTTEPISAETVKIHSEPDLSFNIQDPKSDVENTLIAKELLQKIADTVCVIHSDNPGKCYLDIFEARYIKELKQKEISELLNISQSEISKRLIELSKLIKRRIET